MSWRILLATLLLGIAASVWGGLQLGNWLIENGPLKSDVFDAYQDLYSVPTLDADGKPYVPAPPQPLVDGRLAVPETPEPEQWEIDTATDLLTERPPIALATAAGGFGGGNVTRNHVSPSGSRFSPGRKPAAESINHQHTQRKCHTAYRYRYSTASTLPRGAGL